MWLTEDDGPTHLALPNLTHIAGQLTGVVRRDG